MPSTPHVLRLGFSPDPDDVFMWWAIAPADGSPPRLDTAPFRFEPVLLDIQTANERAASTGDLDITAISAAQYPFVASRYAITSCGASFGQNYGPKLVSRSHQSLEQIIAADFAIATPGRRTTAALLAGLMLEAPSTRFVAVPFDETIDRCARGEFQAAVVIHEGQLTFERAGLHLVADLGEWWSTRHQLPLPLGLNVIRRDLEARLGAGCLQRVTSCLSRSIEWGLANRREALQSAARYGRGITIDEADRFVAMYVNRFTRDSGEMGRRAIETLLAEAAGAGWCPPTGDLTLIEPPVARGDVKLGGKPLHK